MSEEQTQHRNAQRLSRSRSPTSSATRETSSRRDGRKGTSTSTFVWRSIKRLLTSTARWRRRSEEEELLRTRSYQPLGHGGQETLEGSLQGCLTAGASRIWPRFSGRSSFSLSLLPSLSLFPERRVSFRTQRTNLVRAERVRDQLPASPVRDSVFDPYPRLLREGNSSRPKNCS